MLGEMGARVPELDDGEDHHQHELSGGQRAEPRQHRTQRGECDRDEDDRQHELE